MAAPQTEPSSAPSAALAPAPSSAPEDSQQPSMPRKATMTMTLPLTPAAAAKKLYEEKYADTHTGAAFAEHEDFIGYAVPDWQLSYVGETQDGAAYEFEEAYFEGEAKAVQSRWLVPLDGSEIRLLDSEAAE